MFKLTFLGTSSGVPTRSRNVSGLAVQAEGVPGWMLVDCGEGTQQRVQRAGLSLHELRAVCITHVHGDHCYGLPGLLASTGMGRRSAPLTLIAPQPAWDWLQATQQLTDLHLPYDIVHVDPQAVADGAQVYAWGGLCITRHALSHRVPSEAYRFAMHEERRRLRTDALRACGLPPGPSWRALQEGEDVDWQGQRLHSADFVERQVNAQAVVVGGDNANPMLLLDACQGAQVLVHEATYTSEALQKVGPGPMHSCAADVAAMAQKAGVPHLVLTHFSPRHQDEAGQAELAAQARALYGGALYMAQDLAVYTLDRAGQLTVAAPACAASAAM